MLTRGLMNGWIVSVSFRRPFFPALINAEQIAGLIMMATNKDALRTIISVRGINPMNCPIMPGQNNNGENAAQVVIVDVMTGQATSDAPRRADSILDNPSMRLR